MATSARDEAWDEVCLRRDRAAALACAGLVVVVIPAWVPFDWMLQPDAWITFLPLRALMAATGVASAAVLWRARDRRTVDGVTFGLLGVVGCGVAWMVPPAVDWYALYVLGFSLVVWGCGLLFTFPAARMAALQALMLAAFLGAHALRPGLHPLTEVAGAGFYLATAALIGVVGSQVRLGLHRDAFDAHRELDEAVLAMAEERAASQAKSAFLARMSHELRTPLNAILGYTELVREELRDAGVELGVQDLHRVDAAGRHLLSLIDDVLDLSRVESGQLTLDLAPCDLRGPLRELVDAARPASERRGLALGLDLPAEPVVVTTDVRRFRQVLQNLLSNAIKFTERGGVEVALAPTPAGAEVQVRDTGPGIPEELRSRVFEPFVQGDASTTRRHDGSGLGLAIVRELVGRLGGEVAVASGPGGSTFTVRLPR